MEALRVIEGELSTIGVHSLSNNGFETRIPAFSAVDASSGGYFL
jgi:hypothetical protein